MGLMVPPLPQSPLGRRDIMLLWLRQQQNPQPQDKQDPPHIGWIFAFVFLLTALIPFILWLDLHVSGIPPETRSLSQRMTQERWLSLTLLITLSTALLWRWKTQLGTAIRYAVLWLGLLLLALLGYALWFFLS